MTTCRVVSKFSWIILGAVYGDASNPNYKINSTTLHDLIKHAVPSPSTFLLWKRELVKRGVLIEQIEGNERFYTINTQVLFPPLSSDESKRLLKLIRRDVFRETIFNPKNYSPTVKHPAYLAFLFFFSLCVAYLYDRGETKKGGIKKFSFTQRQLLGKAYDALMNFKISKDEELEIENECKEFGRIFEQRSLELILEKL